MIFHHYARAKTQLIGLSLVAFWSFGFAQTLNQPDDGFRGIWYYIGKTNNEYVHKYSGGLGTYPSNHYPFSVYAPAVQKTFFCYGGASKDSVPSLLHEVAYFDHRTKQVSRPTIVLNKKTDDAHDNPVLNMDSQGFIWLFSTSHGTERPSYIHRSRKPYDISAFDLVPATRLKNGQKVPFDNFSYLQIYHQPANGFLGLMTHYERGMLKYGKNKPRRTIGFITSKNGIEWSDIQNIGEIEEGHYQTSGTYKEKIGTAFNMHPDTEKDAGLDYRTNLYYIETRDFGKTWQNANGQTIKLPLTTSDNAALVKDYRAEKQNVYISDLAYTTDGRPVLLYVTSKGPEPGPQNGPYLWHTASWDGKSWQIAPVTESDHNYDMGSLYVENGLWRIVATTQTGPQAYNTGGEIVLWESKNAGKSWQKVQQMTQNSAFNHSYPRKPLRVHPDFYAFWADGHGRQPSESSLYFSNQKGEVFRLPRQMKTATVTPEKVLAEACATVVVPPVIGEQARKDMEAKWAAAKADWNRRPTDADAIIWYGRRTAYLGRYAEAIEIYTNGLRHHPNDARLYRHRGHRYLTLRCLDKAIADFKKAYALTRGKPDETEPDGMPNAKGIPTSTLQSNIRYHLGLCLYLKGEFGQAIPYYEEDLRAARNVDMYVATANWLYLCYRRTNQAQKAQDLLDLKLFRAILGTEPQTIAALPLIENMDYQRILMLHQSSLSPDAVRAEVTQPNSLSNATMTLGLANYYLLNGKTTEGKELYQRLLGGNQWASFAYITAEIEASRN
ncbi:MAG: BNR-4 repeat-containing protein [Spirosomaceae bacterium]|nr:BNR-4 repeat-containing protein [Spirosomataceae bacterium]